MDAVRAAVPAAIAVLCALVVFWAMAVGGETHLLALSTFLGPYVPW